MVNGLSLNRSNNVYVAFCCCCLKINKQHPLVPKPSGSGDKMHLGIVCWRCCNSCPALVGLSPEVSGICRELLLMGQLSEGPSPGLSGRGQLIISQFGHTCYQVEPKVGHGGTHKVHFVNATHRGGSLQPTANISSLLFHPHLLKCARLKWKQLPPARGKGGRPSSQPPQPLPSISCWFAWSAAV